MFDTTLFWQTSNCQPKNVFTGVCASVIVVSAFTLLVLVKSRGKTKNESHRAINWTILNSVALLLMAIVALVRQTFFYSGIWFLMTLVLLGVLGAVTETMYGFFKVAARGLGVKKFDSTRLNVAITLMWFTATLPFVFVAIVCAISTDPAVYNTSVAVFFVLLPIHEVTSVVYISTIPQKLLRLSQGNVANKNLSPEKLLRMKQFSWKLKLLSLILFWGFVPIVSFTSVFMASIFFALGNQIPFAWLFWVLLMAAFTFLPFVWIFFHVDRPWEFIWKIPHDCAVALVFVRDTLKDAFVIELFLDEDDDPGNKKSNYNDEETQTKLKKEIVQSKAFYVDTPDAGNENRKKPITYVRVDGDKGQITLSEAEIKSVIEEVEKDRAIMPMPSYYEAEDGGVRGGGQDELDDEDDEINCVLVGEVIENEQNIVGGNLFFPKENSITSGGGSFRRIDAIKSKNVSYAFSLSLLLLSPFVSLTMAGVVPKWVDGLIFVPLLVLVVLPIALTMSIPVLRKVRETH